MLDEEEVAALLGVKLGGSKAPGKSRTVFIFFFLPPHLCPAVGVKEIRESQYDGNRSGTGYGYSENPTALFRQRRSRCHGPLGPHVAG